MSIDATTITAEDLLAHAAWLQRLARRLVDPSTAEDLVQETWAAAVRSKPDRTQSLRPWLAEVLRNLVRNRARSRSRFETRVPRIVAAEAPLPSPEELLSFHEAQRLVAEAVTTLEEPYRSTVLLCYAQEVPPSEIARRQGIPAGTVRWRLKRGLDQLRATLDARHGNDRKAWRAILAPLAARAGGGGIPAGKVVAGLALVAAAALIVAVTPDAAPPSPSPGRVASARVPRLIAVEGETVVAQAAPAGLVGGGPSPSAGLVATAPLDAAEGLRRAVEAADAPTRGDPKAPVTLVIWSDFQCPFCARASTTLRELEAAYPQQLRIVFKHRPLAFHESALLAAEAALAAHEQGKFWPMHDRLFADRDRLDPASLAAHARALGLDMERWQAALDTGRFRNRVEEDLKVADAAQISGVPTIFVNGARVVGAKPAELKQHIEAALGKGVAPPRPAPPPVVAEAAAPAVGKLALLAGHVWPPPPITLPDAFLGEKLRARFVVGNAPMRGNPNGPVEVLYFTPLGKPPQRVMLEGLLATYGDFVRVVAKILPWPGDPQDPPTLLAEAALYAQAEGKFWPFHDAIVADYPRPDRARIFQIARQVGLDEADLAAALEDGRHRAAVGEERAQFQAAGLFAPAFAVDGRLASSSAALAQLVEEGIRRAGREPPPRPLPCGAPPIHPTDAGYDPQPLLKVMSPRQVFARESRDDAWAGAMEKQLLPLVEKDLRAVVSKVTGIAVDCRTSLCRLRWQVATAEKPWLDGYVRIFYGAADVPPGDENGEQFLALRGPDQQTPDRGFRRLAARRASVIYSTRTGRPTNSRPWPLDRMPQE